MTIIVTSRYMDLNYSFTLYARKLYSEWRSLLEVLTPKQIQNPDSKPRNREKNKKTYPGSKFSSCVFLYITLYLDEYYSNRGYC